MQATTTKPAVLTFRSSCSGTVHIAFVKQGRKVLFESRAWGTDYSAAHEAREWAKSHGVALKG